MKKRVTSQLALMFLNYEFSLVAVLMKMNFRSIVKVEGVTERVIVEVEVLLVIGPGLHLSPNICSHLPKQPPQLSLPVHEHQPWLLETTTATTHNTHRSIVFNLLQKSKEKKRKEVYMKVKGE